MSIQTTLTLGFGNGSFNGSIAGLVLLGFSGTDSIIPTITPVATELDTELIPEIYAILQEVGKFVIFHVPNAETYDPADSEKTEDTVIEHTVLITPPEPFKEEEMDGSQIMSGDMKTLVSELNLGFTPSHDMDVTIDGEVWKIKFIDKIFSGEYQCAWVLGLRGPSGKGTAGVTVDPTPIQTELDRDLIPEVDEILDTLGKQALFYVPGSETYSPLTSEKTESGVQGYIVRITPPEPFAEEEQNGNEIMSGDMKTFIADQDLQFTPVHDMVVGIDNVKWKIKYIDKVYSGMFKCGWILGLRR